MKSVKTGEWVMAPTRELPPSGYRRNFHEDHGIVVKLGTGKQTGAPMALVKFRNCDAAPERQQIAERWFPVSELRRFVPFGHDFWVLWETQNGAVWNGGRGDQVPAVLHFMRDNDISVSELMRRAGKDNIEKVKRTAPSDCICGGPEILNLDARKLALRD